MSCVGVPFEKTEKAGTNSHKRGERQHGASVFGSRNAVAGGAGKRMEVYAERFQWKSGLVVKDWRYAVRLANLDVAELAGLTGSHAPSGGTPVVTNLLHRMAQAIARIPNTAMGRCVFYFNRTVFTALMRLALESGTNSGLKIQDAAREFGTPSNMLSFMGIPIRQCDALLNTEAVVA